ncbi:MAG: hypothetical protein ACSHYA_05530 [Opitutaceae bacterium]
MKAKRIVIVGSLAVVLVIALALLSSYGSRCRCAAKHKVDLNNMRQIATGLAVYAYESKEFYPESLSEAFNPEHGIFREGSYREIIFSRTRHSTKEITLSEIDELTDWIYVRGHTVSSPPDLIVLFTPAGRFKDFRKGEMLVAEIGGTALIMEEEEFIKSMNRTLAYVHSSTTRSEPDGSGQ